MLILGWRLAPIALFHVVPLVLSAVSWRTLIRAPAGPAWRRPSGSAGSASRSTRSCRLLGGRRSSPSGLPRPGGLPAVDAAASVVANAHDRRRGGPTRLRPCRGCAAPRPKPWRRGARSGVRASWRPRRFRRPDRGLSSRPASQSFATILRLAHSLAPAQGLAGLEGGAAKVDDAIVATYRRRGALASASLVRLADWAVGAGEVWLVLFFLGRPFGVVDAFVLESLSSGVRAAAFLAPEGWGRRKAPSSCSVTYSDCQPTWRWRFRCQSGCASSLWACLA